MNDDIGATIVQALAEIAPDVDVSALDPSADLRDEAELDSVDFLNFVAALHDATGVDIPERDYSQVRTLDDCRRYLAARVVAGDAT
jgi:acyl carrier protein